MLVKLAGVVLIFTTTRPTNVKFLLCTLDPNINKNKICEIIKFLFFVSIEEKFDAKS